MADHDSQGAARARGPACAAGVASRLSEALPTNDLAIEGLLDRGAQLAALMSWDVVAGKFIMPVIDELCQQWPAIRVA